MPIRPVSAAVLVVVLAATAAAPAVGQTPPPRATIIPQASAYEAMLAAQQEMAARQAVILQNDISRLDSQMRTQQNLATLKAMGDTPMIPPPPATGLTRNIDVSGLAAIPDSALADSNAKVKAAADNRP